MNSEEWEFCTKPNEWEKKITTAKTKEEVIRIGLEEARKIGLYAPDETQNFEYMTEFIIQTLNDLDRAEQVPEEQEIPVRFF